MYCVKASEYFEDHGKCSIESHRSNETQNMRISQPSNWSDVNLEKYSPIRSTFNKHRLIDPPSIHIEPESQLAIMNSGFSPIKSLKKNKYNEEFIDRQRVALEKYAEKKLSTSSSTNHSDSTQTTDSTRHEIVRNPLYSCDDSSQSPETPSSTSRSQSHSSSIVSPVSSVSPKSDESSLSTKKQISRKRKINSCNDRSVVRPCPTSGPSRGSTDSNTSVSSGTEDRITVHSKDKVLEVLPVKQTETVQPKRLRKKRASNATETAEQIINGVYSSSDDEAIPKTPSNNSPTTTGTAAHLSPEKEKETICAGTVESDFSDCDAFLSRIGEVIKPITKRNKRQRYIYGSKAEDYIEECRDKKAPNPFTKHIAEFSTRQNNKNVSFIAKLVKKTAIKDCQNTSGESFSIAFSSILDSDARIDDSTCVMRGTIIHNDILKKSLVDGIRQVRKSLIVGEVYAFKKVKLTKSKNIPPDIAEIANHPCHILLDVFRLHLECIEKVTLEDISSDEEDDLPEPGTLSTHGPKKDYTFYPNTQNYGNIKAVVSGKDRSERYSLAVSIRQILGTSETTVWFTVYGCTKSHSTYLFARAKGYDRDSVRQTCTICNVEHNNRFAVCAVARFHETREGKAGYEIYNSRIHTYHLLPVMALC